MENICPSGHKSSQADFCSECGLEINPGSSAQSAPPDASKGQSLAAASSGTKEQCPKCHTERDSATAQFCGVCGYDYISKQGGEVIAPEPHAAPVLKTTAPQASAQTAPASGGARMDIRVSVDASKPNAPTGHAPLTFSLFEEESLIGRRSSKVPQTVPIDDAAVSTRHALVIRRADGSYAVRDLNSMNGTTLNGKAVKAGADEPLKEGDVITVGEFTFITVVSIRKA
jgi:hypothetical protein